MLTDNTKNSLEVAMASTKRAEEFEALLFSPGPMGSELSRDLEIAMADKKSAAEVQNAAENGLGSLSKRSGDALAIALASNKAAEEMFTF